MTQPSTATATQLPAVLQRVLVATDTSTASAGAELAAIELAAMTGASLIVLSVIDPTGLRLPGGLFHTRVDQVRTQRGVALGRVVESARRRGLSAQFLIWEGDPGSAVIEAAEAESADVIIVGSHARGAVGRLLLGSVSTFVVNHGRCPVIVIRSGQELDDVWPVNASRDGPIDPRRSAARPV